MPTIPDRPGSLPGSGKKAGEFYTPQQVSDILSAIVTLDSQEPKTGVKHGWTA